MKQTDDATPKRREETERPDEVFQLLAFQRDELREGGSEGKREKSYKIKSSQCLGGRGRSVRAADGRSTWHTHGVDNIQENTTNLRKSLLGFSVLTNQARSRRSLELRLMSL